MNAKQQALKVAAARALSDIVAEGYERIRKEAEPVFAELRKDSGTKSLDVEMPDGTVLGPLSILAGPATRKYRMSTLAAIVANDDPDELVEELRPEALTDPDLIEFVRDHMPHLLYRKIRDAHLKSLFKKTDSNGYLKDAAGTRIQVADVTRQEPTGEFRYKPDEGARAVVWKAWEAGELQPLIGDLLKPAIEAGEQHD
ncbi:hypothetical protein Sme01_04120 [Sphaerisporangium melleum]|uniref:Uncharacterized protein n=1 Tax=Sphaerisporangium melleum TaxID=321316 RepID=A0A917QP89_9ACTN|nr:hypothetical protein [Sphaerisporangium melleum]GGK62146.1 hypothetical protein GCM10007964_01670 [Sphaerisporangium melleum]GII67936.1 hypothetical protein Sme01_04120 [Sphaerisporangium melleum]